MERKRGQARMARRQGTGLNGAKLSDASDPNPNRNPNHNPFYTSRLRLRRLLQNPSGVFCKREVRIQKTGYRIIEHVDRERFTILNTEFWLLNTALAEPTQEVLQAALLC
jgi:hypothetical protein